MDGLPRGVRENWGGKRNPAGAAAPRGSAPRVQVSVRLAPETDEKIKRLRREGESYAATIDRLVAQAPEDAP